MKLYFQNEKDRYCISSDGMATNRVFFRHHQPTGKEKDAFQDKDIFIVIPITESRVLSRLKTDIKICTRRAKKDKYAKSADTNKENEENDLMKKDEGYQQDVPEEIMNNFIFQKSMIGKPVKYNTTIQLVHEQTQQYVRVSRKLNLSPACTIPNKTRTGKIKSDFLRVYSLKLDPCSGPETQFMLTPCFKYQSNDEVLQEGSFCLTYKDTQLLNKRFYLHFESTGTKAFTIVTFYMTEDEKSPIRFEFQENPALKGHLFEKLHGEALWITHIQENMYLSLNRIEKVTDQDENALNELIEQVDEALSQALFLSFKEYDPATTISSDGLWIGYTSKSPNEIIFKHLQYFYQFM